MWSFVSHARTEAIDVEVLVDDDVQQRVARRAFYRHLLPVSIDEVHRHLVVRPEARQTSKKTPSLFINTNQHVSR